MQVDAEQLEDALLQKRLVELGGLLDFALELGQAGGVDRTFLIRLERLVDLLVGQDRLDHFFGEGVLNRLRVGTRELLRHFFGHVHAPGGEPPGPIIGLRYEPVNR